MVHRDPSRDPEKTRQIHLSIALLILAILTVLTTQICSPRELRGEDSGFTVDQIRAWTQGLAWCNYNNQYETTGFFVSRDGVIVTVLHLVSGLIVFAKEYPIYVLPYGEQDPYRAEILGYNQSADLLFLKIDYRPKHWFDRFSIPAVGQKCLALGFPLGWVWQSEGRIITHIKSGSLGMNRLPAPGASGSPVLSENGEILGMIRGKHVDYAILTPGIVIKNSLATLRGR